MLFTILLEINTLFSKVDCTYLINNIVNFLHQKLSKVNVDESLSEVDQLQAMLSGLKDYSSILEENLEKKTIENVLNELVHLCANTQSITRVHNFF